MRIGIDIRLQHETGVGRYIRNLMAYLPKMDTKNEYVFMNPDIPWHGIEEQVKMPRIIKSHQVDLMHFPYFNVPVFYTKPFVVTIHDLIVNEYSTGQASTRHPLIHAMKRYGYGRVMNHAVTQANGIIVPSQATKHKLLDLYPQINNGKVHVTYEGVDLVRSQKQKMSNPKIKKISKFFLYVGNAYPHKNVEALIHAVAAIKNSETKLVIVGKRNFFMNRLGELVQKLDMQNQIVFTDEITDEELVWLYTHAQALVLPSLMEGFGLPAVEAMQLRCPLVLSDIPVFHEICNGAAYYFTPENKAELTDILIKIEKNPQSREINQKKDIGEKRSKQFKWETMVQETISIYEDSVTSRA